MLFFIEQIAVSGQHHMKTVLVAVSGGLLLLRHVNLLVWLMLCFTSVSYSWLLAVEASQWCLAVVLLRVGCTGTWSAHVLALMCVVMSRGVLA